MKDLDQYTTRTVVTERPKLHVVPSGPVAETEQKRGFTVRTRGDTGGTVLHQYRCPVHGQFDALVPRGEVPDAVDCTKGIEGWYAVRVNNDVYVPAECEAMRMCCQRSPWAGSRCGIGVSSGYVES